VPAGESPFVLRGGRRDSNPRLPGPQPGALPTELRPPRREKCSPGLRCLGRRWQGRQARGATDNASAFSYSSLAPRAQDPGASGVGPWTTTAGEERGGSLRRNAPVAQWTEQRTSNPRVAGSNPARRIRKTPGNGRFSLSGRTAPRAEWQPSGQLPVEPLRLDALSRDRDPEIEGRRKGTERGEPHKRLVDARAREKIARPGSERARWLDPIRRRVSASKAAIVVRDSDNGKPHGMEQVSVAEPSDTDVWAIAERRVHEGPARGPVLQGSGL
jgi:hypothetical protein